MTDRELDILMSKVLFDSIKLEIECGGKHNSSFKASNRHRSQMRSMLKNPLNWAKKRSRPLWENTLRKVAAAILIITISFGVIAAINPSVRAVVIRWALEWYETHIVYKYFGAELDTEMPYYDIAGLGNDYAETDRTVSDQAVSILYENGSGGVICFDYNYLHDGGAGIFVFNDTDVTDITVNHMKGQLHMPHDPEAMPAVTWIDEQEHIHFRIFVTLDEKEIIRIAESVYKK